MDVVHEASFGIIPMRLGKVGWEVLVIRHLAGHWGFPKGRPDGESVPLETAKRELMEETGLAVLKVLRKTPFVESYTFERGSKIIDKTVSYFPARVQGTVRIQKEELAAFEWVPLDLAKERVTFGPAKAICQAVEDWVREQEFTP